MSGQKISIVFDCGATNVKVYAINEKGEIVKSKSYPNNTREDPNYPEFRIWDINEIWGKMCLASREVISGINTDNIIGVTATSFGVDGSLFDASGNMLYPMISWQCERTNPILANIHKYIPPGELYSESGVLPYNFNTINKAIWFKENRPGLLNDAHRFLFASSIFLYLLSGEMKNDITMAGTSMMTSAANRKFSSRILNSIGFPSELTGDLAEAGEIIGHVNAKAEAATGLPSGIPVIATGHDTQFAVFGSGANIHQPVLSSGTWEILMVRSEEFRAGPEQLNLSISTELDAIPGIYNIGNQWIASGMIEWASKNMFSDIKNNKHEYMISAAEKIPPGSNGISVIPRFNQETDGKAGGQIHGLKIESTREEVYRAMLESLSLRLRESLKDLEKAGGFKADTILCVGGGSKNKLWNQIRADISGMALRVVDNTETTALGASMFVMYAAGMAGSPDEARAMIPVKSKLYEPGENHKLYKELLG